MNKNVKFENDYPATPLMAVRHVYGSRCMNVFVPQTERLYILTPCLAHLGLHRFRVWNKSILEVDEQY